MEMFAEFATVTNRWRTLAIMAVMAPHGPTAFHG